MKRRFFQLLALALLLPRLAEADAPADPRTLRPLAERFWAAEVRQDFNAVYDMLSPAERDSIERSDYVALRKDTGPFHYLAAEVGEIESAGALAWVNVNFDWTSPKHRSTGRPGATWHLWKHDKNGWFPIPLDERDKWPILPPRLRPAADEAALTERTIGLWKAKAAQDWKSVYEYMPPSWREKTKLEDFLRMKARFLYLSPRVEWVEVKGSEARASVLYEAKFNDPAVSKMKPRPEKVIEPWMKVDGTWYLALPVIDQTRAKDAGK